MEIMNHLKEFDCQVYISGMQDVHGARLEHTMRSARWVCMLSLKARRPHCVIHFSP